MPEIQPGQSVIALTGATGFIGQHLQARLLDSGYRVRTLVRRSSANSPKLLPDCTIAAVDLHSEESIAAALENVQAVIYAAGSVRGRCLDDYQLANVSGVAATAAAISGLAKPIPMLLLSSMAASAPELSDYAQSKAAGERALRSSGLSQWSIVRPPAVYGPGDKEMRPIFDAMRRGVVPLIAPADQHLPFIEVSDLASAVLAWVTHHDRCAGGTFAIDDGTPNGYDWPRIAELIAPAGALRVRVPAVLLNFLAHVNLALSKLAGYAPMLTPGKVRELTYLGWVCDNAAFTAATGWRPQLDLADGVARLFTH